MYWDGLGDGYWHDLRWVDADASPLSTVPNQFNHAVVRNDHVTIAANASVRGLEVESGQVTVSNAVVLDVGGKLVLGPGEGDQLTIDGQLVIPGQMHYVPELDEMDTGQARATATATMALGGTLRPHAVDYLGDPEHQVWGGYTRTVLTSDVDLSGQSFDTVPPVHCFEGHLGHGVFMTDVFDPGAGGHGAAVTYDNNAVHIDLFQAAAGDVNGNRQLNGDDIQSILAANTFGTGYPADWTTGDFNDDGICNGDDIQLMLSTGLWATPPGETYWPPGGGLGRGGGQLELIVTPAAAMADVDDATVRCWILASPEGVFRFFSLDGEHHFADAFMDQREGFDFGSVPLLESVTLSYTIEARAGDFEGSLLWASADPSGMDADSETVAATLAYYTEYYLNREDLKVEIAHLADTAAFADLLAYLERFDPRGDSDDTPSRDGLVYLFSLYGE